MEQNPEKNYASVCVCNLNQWALDFDGNLRRIIQSISIAKQLGAKLRVGPELEVCGYGCEDHFLESDTFEHSWESVAKLLESDLTDGILCHVGVPVLHKCVNYNCSLFILNRKILLIRPKLYLANDGNYREGRYFSQWRNDDKSLDTYILPEVIQNVTGQKSTVIGTGVIKCLNTSVASETCEELWTPLSPHTDLSLDGIEVFCNGSSSHHQLGKMNQRIDLILSATSKCGGVYLYSNQRGCDGGRLYYDGGAFVSMNGKVVTQTAQFGLASVEVAHAIVDLKAVRAMRVSIPSRCQQAAAYSFRFPSVDANISLHPDCAWLDIVPTPFLKQPVLHTAMQEIALGPACWLWDYLRRSNSSGFFVPLSGGADSSSVVAIVGSMCQIVIKEIYEKKNEEVLCDLERLIGMNRDETSFPKTPHDVCYHILHTCFMGTRNSSSSTKKLSAELAKEIGSFHVEGVIDTIVNAFLSVFEMLAGKRPKFLKHGGSMAEDLALQNIQARIRMVLSYLLASLLPWVRKTNNKEISDDGEKGGKKYGGGWLLVLATGNVDEGLRGYLTKYDCSSGDINPIGSISKLDLRQFIEWASKKENLGYSTLSKIAQAVPTAELRPPDEEEEEGGGEEQEMGEDDRNNESKKDNNNNTSTGEDSNTSNEDTLKTNTKKKVGHSQTDEEDMGMTYEELGLFGKIRKVEKCGPVSMFIQLIHTWKNKYPLQEIGRKVKHFFVCYATNRHKMCVLTPSYHAESYSPDDNRYDHRPILYNTKFDRQFRTIDNLISQSSELTK